MGNHIPPDFTNGKMEDISLSTMTVGTQRRLIRAESAERDLLEDNESTENLDFEKEEKMALSRTLNAAHRRRWNAFVCVLMIVVTLPLFAFGGYALSLQHQEYDNTVRWASFESVGQKVSQPRFLIIDLDNHHREC